MYRILVCDDEEEIVSSLTACLTAEGYQVVTARTGWEVLNILSKQPIHLALLGTKLPGWTVLPPSPGCGRCMTCR